MTKEKEMYIGTIAWYNLGEGYGFVKVDDIYKDYGGKEIFFHKKNITKHDKITVSLSRGDTVSFNVKNGKKLSAINLARIISYDS